MVAQAERPGRGSLSRHHGNTTRLWRLPALARAISKLSELQFRTWSRPRNPGRGVATAGGFARLSSHRQREARRNPGALCLVRAQGSPRNGKAMAQPKIARPARADRAQVKIPVTLILLR